MQSNSMAREVIGPRGESIDGFVKNSVFKLPSNTNLDVHRFVLFPTLVRKYFDCNKLMLRCIGHLYHPILWVREHYEEAGQKNRTGGWGKTCEILSYGYCRAVASYMNSIPVTYTRP